LHPASLAERLFRRFAAIYGTQKYSVMWSGLVQEDPRWTDEDRRLAWADAMREVEGVWSEALSCFHVDVIAASVRSLATSEQMWPPSLPEFCAICRDQEERMKPSAANLVQIGDDTPIADPNSPRMKQAMDELREMMKMKRMPS